MRLSLITGRGQGGATKREGVVIKSSFTPTKRRGEGGGGGGGGGEVGADQVLAILKSVYTRF